MEKLFMSHSPKVKVIKSIHKKTKEIYAIKIISLRANQSEELIFNEIKFFEKFYQMATTPNCFPEYNGYIIHYSQLRLKTYHIVFKYYPQTLRDVINKQTIFKNFELIREYFYQIVNGLAFLQVCGIAHRDIKPENILVNESASKLFICDFNIAITYENLPKTSSLYVGTEAYRCPEWVKNHLNQIEKDIIDPLKAECFSLGLVVLEMGGIQNNLKNEKNYQSYWNSVQEMQNKFENSFMDEISNKESERNKIFFEDIKNLLKEKPECRIDFLQIFKKNLKYKNVDKLKFHVFIQEHSYLELRPFSKKIFKEEEKILDEIYDTLNQFFICEVGPNADLFREKSLKNFKTIEKYVNLNNSKALLFKGILNEWGINQPQNLEDAKNYYLKSFTSKEEPYSLYRYGILNQGENEYIYQCRSAAAGNSYGIFRLGVCYRNGFGCEKNEQKAFELFNKSADLGNVFGNFKQ